MSGPLLRSQRKKPEKTQNRIISPKISGNEERWNMSGKNVQTMLMVINARNNHVARSWITEAHDDAAVLYFWSTVSRIPILFNAAWPVSTSTDRRITAMLTKMRIFLFIVCSIFILAGCQDKSQSIFGAWKSTAPTISGKIAVAVFEKDKMIFNGTHTSSVTYKNKDDKLVAHLDHTSWLIEFLDDNTIMVTNGTSGLGSTTKYMRTSSEDAENINSKNNTRPKSEPKGW